MLDYSYFLSTPRHLYCLGDCLVLYNIPTGHEYSVDCAVLNLVAMVTEAINQAILFVKYRKSSFPHWFSSALKYYINKKN
jgi:hypothetical protein